MPNLQVEAARRRFEVDGGDSVSALMLRPPSARWLFVFAHGAGAGMEHPGMDTAARRLADLGVATFRYQFPYMEAGRRAPDRPPRLIATVRAAVAAAGELAGDLELVAGGRSMGGRMTSTAQSQSPLPGIRGLAFYGFPLHPAAKPGVQRADHLAGVDVPMLFLQGTRDKLADLELLGPVVEGLGDLAELHVVEGADHGFQVLVRSGRTADQVADELAETFVSWLDGLGGPPVRR
ncbi:MAG: alpha/beta family hydrolase [Acidobacteriota bacterium]